MLYKIPQKISWIISVMMMLLLFMTLYRFYFFFHYHDITRPFSGSAFVLGLRYDARMISILGLFLVIGCSIPKFNPVQNVSAIRWWTMILSFLFLITIIFYATDFYYYDYLKQRLNASVLNFLADANISGGMVWQTYPVIRISLLIFFLVGLFHFINLKLLQSIHSNSTEFKRHKYHFIHYGIFIILLSGFTFGKLDQYPLRWSDAFLFSDNFKANTALNPFQSFFSSLQFKDSKYDLEKVKEYYPMMASFLAVSDKDLTTLNFKRKVVFNDTSSLKPNIVVVICESFSAYKSSMFGNKLNPTPYFNTLCNEGVFFERCFTPAFGTARGVWATITGIPDVQQPKTSSRNPMAVDQHTIMNDFTDYEKYYFLGGSTTWANIRGVLKNNIEDLNIYEQENFSSSRADVWGISDKNLFLESSKILAKHKKPFFAIIQTADNHRPYTIPQEDLKEFTRVNYSSDTLTEYGFDSNDQLNAFRYTDFNFKKFIEATKKENYFNNTIFIFVGDHGLRGNAGKMFPESFTKQGILAEHVPLLFYAPKILKPARVKHVCSQVDIMPTVASLAKHNHTNTTIGRNLFDSSISEESVAFIADPDLLTIGLVNNEFYFSRNIKTNKKEFVSVVNNNPVPENSTTNRIKERMSKLTEACYETSKYLLLNNKKNN